MSPGETLEKEVSHQLDVLGPPGLRVLGAPSPGFLVRVARPSVLVSGLQNCNLYVRVTPGPPMRR